MGSLEVDGRSLQILNTHLGKAGGLNFGLEAVLMTDGVSATRDLPLGFDGFWAVPSSGLVA